MTQPPLLPVYTVHCFFGWCSHHVSEYSPIATHDAMERHYRSIHAAHITRLIPPLPRAIEREITHRV